MEKLVWMPLYIDSLLSSPAWQDMKDYQRGWYLQLLLRCTRSERLGYLSLDEKLWKIAGAHSKAMWDNHSAVVMACFKIRQIDDKDWIYNDRLLSVMEEQSQKYYRKRTSHDRPSVSSKTSALEVDLKPSNSDEVVERIVRLHPANWHLKDSLQLPQSHCTVVIEAIQRDGQAAVELGTLACADTAEKYPLARRNMIPGPVKFWGLEAHYLKKPDYWEVYLGGEGGQASKTQQRVSNNRAAIIEGLYGKDARPVSEDDGLRADVGRVDDMGKRALKAGT